VTEIVVDTSVAFKWFITLGEDAVDEATQLLSAHLAGHVSLIAPASLPLELANGLRYSPVTQSDVLELIGTLDLTHIELFDLTPTRLAEATSLAYEHGITVYDAVFLALAVERDCELVTADRRAFGAISTTADVRIV